MSQMKKKDTAGFPCKATIIHARGGRSMEEANDNLQQYFDDSQSGLE